MKKIYSLIIAFFVSLAMSAGEVTEQQALQKAQQFMQGKKFQQTNLRRAASAAGNAYYVFNAENNGGFVIVAGDDRVKDILGYSERGSFDLSKAPSNVRWWLGQYEKAISSLGKETHREISHRAETVKDEIVPFITTTWGQNYPYNSQCPEINGEYCATGCVATAMAQVINYTKWPESAIGEIAGYTTKTNQIAVPKLEATTFDWNNMTDTDIARLMRYCGQAVKMDYGLGESGSYDANIPGALIGKFGYDNNIRIVYRNGYNSETWENMMYNELKAGRPVIYGGQSGNNGHSFICHGYMDGMYYINWGWDGMFDGYFALTALNPDGNGAYGKDQTAIIGIQKSTGGDIVSTPKVTVTKITLASAETITRSANSDNFTGIKVECALQNSFTEAKTVQSGFALYQGTELKSVLGYGNVEFSPGIVITPSSTFALGAGLTDGTYRIVPVYRESESLEWIAAEGSNYRYVEAVIAGNTLTLKVMPDVAHDERLKYTVISDSKVEVSAANTEIEGNIVIPKVVEVDGILYKVSGVAIMGFSGCRNIDSIDMPSSMEYWDYHAFYGCDKLKEITIPKALEIIAPGAIGGCDALTTINIEEGNSCFMVKDGAILSANGEFMYAYAGGLAPDNYIIPESVKYLSNEVFQKNSHLKVVTFNSNISTIPQAAFYDASALKTVNLGQVEVISQEAFENSSIEKIEILSPVKSIGNRAFYSCNSLTSVVCKQSSPILINKDVFESQEDKIYSTAVLYIPKGRMEFFEQAEGWRYFKHIVEIDMQDVIISRNPFESIDEKQMILGYYRTDELEQGRSIGGLGVNIGCIGFNRKSVAPFVGKVISSIRFGLANADIENVKIWISNSKEKRDGYIQLVEKISEGWNVVKLNTPYQIQDEDLFIGVEFINNNAGLYPLHFIWQGNGLSGIEPSTNFFKCGTENWIDMYDSSEHGSLSIQCILEGESLPLYDLHSYGGLMNTVNFNKYYRAGQDELIFDAQIKNWGKFSVDNFELTASLDGNNIQGRQYGATIDYGNYSRAAYGVDIPKSIKPGIHQLDVSVASIGNQTPLYPLDDLSSGKIRIYSKSVKRQKTLMMHYTATWCPGAMRTINDAKDILDDNPDIVQVSFHSADELSTDVDDEYYKFSEYVGILGFDRYYRMGDRYIAGTIFLPELKDVPSFADVNISGSYNAKTKELYIVVKGMRNEELVLLHDNLNLTVLLTENDVISPQYDGENKTWVPEFKHQSVVRAHASAIWGDPIVWDGDNYEMRYSIRLNDEWIADNMHVVAFIGEPFNGSNYNDINVINCNDFAVKDAEQIISIDPIEESVEKSFSKQMDGTTDLSNTVIDNTYFNMNAANGDGYSSTEQALVLNSTTTSTQMHTVQDAQVGDAVVKDNFCGVIFEVPAGQGTITVDAKTIGTHVLNVQVGNGAPTKVTKSERGTVDVTYDVAAATYVYLYASTADGSAAPLHHAATVGANSVLLYGYKVTIGSGTGINAVTIDKPVDVYTLQGQKVLSGVTTLSGLTKGVYIINGRKVVVK